MKVLFYADWPLAHDYLDPVHDFIAARHPDWELTYAGAADPGRYLINRTGVFDVAFVCDERTACPPGPRICLFHGLASKGQAYSTARRMSHVRPDVWYAVPSAFYRTLLLELGVAPDRIEVTGLTKLDGYEKRVLYAPTHNGELSAIPVIGANVYAIPNVTVRLHDVTVRGYHDITRTLRDIHHTHTRRPVQALMREHDVVIGDLGSVALEAIALGKQTIQVINPAHENFYLGNKGLTREQMLMLPEWELAGRYAIRVWSWDELWRVLNDVCVLGGSVERVYRLMLHVVEHRR